MEEVEGLRVPNLSNEQLEKLEEQVATEMEKRAFASNCLSCPACGSTELAWTKFDVPHRSEQDGENIYAWPSRVIIHYSTKCIKCNASFDVFTYQRAFARGRKR